MKKVIVLTIVFLFLVVGVVPSVSAKIGNDVKEDSSFYGNFTVVGFLKMIHQSTSNNEIIWECTWFALVFGMDNDNNFVLLGVKKGQNLVTQEFVNGIISIIVYGHCSYFSIE